MLTIDIDETAAFQYDAATGFVRCRVVFTLETGTTNVATGLHDPLDVTVIQTWEGTIAGATNAEKVEDLHRQLLKIARSAEAQRREQKTRFQAINPAGLPLDLRTALFDPRTAEYDPGA